MAILASNGTAADVQAKVTAAVSGDTVTLPAGSFNWTTKVIVTGKALILQGAGEALTTVINSIPDAANDPGSTLRITATATNFVRVTGIKFTQAIAHASGTPVISVTGTNFEVAFRIHACRTVQTLAGRGIQTTSVYGLIDDNDLDMPVSLNAQSISVQGGDFNGADAGFLAWQQPLSLGTNKAVYIENNRFNRIAAGFATEDCIDAYAGARIVIRNNTFTNAHHGFHGHDSGSIRSPVSFEIYDNTYTNASGSTGTACVVRGGTGVIYSNTYTGLWGGITLKLYRACENPNLSSWMTCDGTDWEVGSASIANGRSRTSTAIQGGTTGAMTNAAGYPIGTTTITVAAGVGAGKIVGGVTDASGRIVGDTIFFGTSNVAHRVTSTNPAAAVDIAVGGTVTFTPAIGGGSDPAIPAAQTAITNGGFKFNTADKETIGAEGGSYLGRWDGPLAAFGYPCRDQPGMAPGQVVTPIYVWNNAGRDAGVFDAWAPFNCQGHGPAHYMQSGRDYVNNGLTAPGPSIYPGPLAYPHPLIGGAPPDTLAPAAPTGVTLA